MQQRPVARFVLLAWFTIAGGVVLALVLLSSRPTTLWRDLPVPMMLIAFGLAHLLRERNPRTAQIMRIGYGILVAVNMLNLFGGAVK